MKIINVIRNFKLLDSFENCKLGRTKELYSTSGIKEWVQRIEFHDSQIDEVIKMDMYGLKESTKVYSLNEKEFKEDYFQELCLLFGLDFKIQLKKHALICIEKEERLASIAIKKSQDGMIYVSIFHIDSGDSRRDSTLYIEGIWKTTLPKFIIHKLFMSS